MALTFTPVENDLHLPAFRLQDLVSEKMIDQNAVLAGPGNQGALIMFICNHCPYVQAIEDRLITLAHDLKQLGIPTFAICSNDASEHPEDRPENLKRRAREKSYPFPYLHDPTQEIAFKFGAVCTPDFFLFNAQGHLTYRGRLDNSWKDATKVTQRELYQAAVAMVENKKPAWDVYPSMGCSIKWLAEPNESATK